MINSKKITVSLVISLVLTTNVLAATFSDVSKTNKYYIAINYLADNGVISGYPDGTFQPDKNISRVEFLKILLESSKIPTDVSTPTGFKDVDESAWYAKYIRKAKQQHWIEGYSDNTFKPAQSVNKVEALKITAKVQNWQVKTTLTSAPFNDTPVTAWYSTYIDYAKTKNFLEESGRFFIPDALYNRGQVSELLFRADITALSKATIYSINLLKNLPAATNPAPAPTPAPQPPPIVNNGPIPNPPISPAPAQDFTPVIFDTIPSNFFSNITLDNSAPNTFYLNEIYHFEGTITSGSYKQAFAFLAPLSTPNDQSSYINYTTDVSGNSIDIPVTFRTPGNYKLGIILGNSGESKIVNISVLPALPTAGTNTAPATPASPDIVYQNQTTNASWTGGANNILTRITFFQANTTKQYLTRQGLNKLTVDYSDFKNFSEGNTWLQIEQAKLDSTKPLQINSGWALSPAKTFTITTHNYNLIDTDSITVSSMPGVLNSIQPITFSGTLKTNTYKKAAVIKPDGQVETFDLTTSTATIDHLGSAVIPTGGNFIFNYSPKTTGTYIVEINNQDGEATLNTGIYISNGIPLIPDFFDFDHSNDTELNFTLDTGRTKLLNLINQARQKAGLKAVVLDSELNNLAQLHSQDMLTRNFFGHINPDGLSPDDRRKKLNIATSVGENLAKSNTLIYANNGLMQSAIHRENILDPTWARVGLGIVKDATNYLLTTEEFSTYPLTNADLNNLKIDLINKLNTARAQIGNGSISSDITLENIALDWSQKMIDQNFFDFTSPNGESLSSNISAQIKNKAVQVLILSSNSQAKLSEQILASSDLKLAKWTFIGLGMKVDNVGVIKATLLYTTN